MKDPLQLLVEDMNVDASFRRILAGKPVSPSVTDFAMLERLRLMAAMEGALIMLKDVEHPNAIAAATILKGAMV